MFRDIAYPEQLSILQAAHNQRCVELGVDPKGKHGADIARRIIELYQGGCQTPDCLRDALKGYSLAS